MSEPRSFGTSIETVLVVDDEVVARMVISEYSRHCGYRVIEAANSDEALAVLAACRDFRGCGALRHEPGWECERFRPGAMGSPVQIRDRHHETLRAAGGARPH
jgi:hypothetical protein